MSHAQMLSLYRQIIRNARVYPSKSRDRVLQEIRVEVSTNNSFQVASMSQARRKQSVLSRAVQEKMGSPPSKRVPTWSNQSPSSLHLHHVRSCTYCGPCRSAVDRLFGTARAHLVKPLSWPRSHPSFAKAVGGCDQVFWLPHVFSLPAMVSMAASGKPRRCRQCGVPPPGFKTSAQP